MPTQTEADILASYKNTNKAAIVQAYYELSREVIESLSGVAPPTWLYTDAATQAATTARVLALLGGGTAGASTPLPLPSPAVGTIGRKVIQVIFESLLATLKGL